MFNEWVQFIPIKELRVMIQTSHLKYVWLFLYVGSYRLIDPKNQDLFLIEFINNLFSEKDGLELLRSQFARQSWEIPPELSRLLAESSSSSSSSSAAAEATSSSSIVVIEQSSCSMTVARQSTKVEPNLEANKLV